jgi:hypothetical protein
MGRRKWSDTNRAANFTKGDQDQATKRIKIEHNGRWAPGKENQPVCQMEEHLTDSRQVSVSPNKKHITEMRHMKSRFRLARDSHKADTHSDNLGQSFHEFQVYTGTNDGNVVKPENSEKQLLTFFYPRI